MPLGNCKVELKLEWVKHCVLSAGGNINTDSNPENIFIITLYVPVGFERSVYCNEYKATSESKNATNNYKCFLESNFEGVGRLFVFIYYNEDDNAIRCKVKTYYLPKGTISDYNDINGKNVCDQAIDSDIKQFKEI